MVSQRDFPEWQFSSYWVEKSFKLILGVKIKSLFFKTHTQFTSALS